MADESECLLRKSMSRQAVTALATAGAFGIMCTVAAPSASAIVGGNPVADGKRPFVVQIEEQGADGAWSHFCGGALIDSRVVATAAHCAKLAVQGKIKIRIVLGRADSSTPGGTVVTDDHFSVYSHPTFSTLTNTDLGLIVLDRPADQAGASLPPLQTKPQPGRLLRAAGWGRTDLADPDKPSRLREAALPVTELDTEEGTWDKQFICAGTAKSRVAPGDSGGPLFDPNASRSGKAVVYGLVTGETNTCQGLFTNLADPAIWKPFREPLASHGLSHVIPAEATHPSDHPSEATRDHTPSSR
ncbi:serine protease [Streptomyces sp. NBC_00654]|uniref:S1 family peptidase n=1 Tax=Streptomyces sp. NBC_00654 TaxID=2975799 RepID=UPI00225AFF75|nr:serine protease [Streptomyces sp. NBC_00654]MCX4966981.1 serine protease [Streptomyces sp. NBC_00654]